MKIFRNSETASVLVLGLVTSAVLVVGLASYLTLVEAQSSSVMRSQTWNAAIPAAEAGVEDALSHLNSIGEAWRETNGYVLTGNMFTISREVGEFRYSVGIDMSNQPAIYATGYVRAPKRGDEISRVVRVQTTRAASGIRGMVAINSITMNGNCSADSFNSHDPNLSTNGQYDPKKNNDDVVVGAVNGDIDTGGGKIYGYIATGPNGDVDANVGSFGYLASNTGTEAGHHQTDLNAYYPPAEPPFEGGASFPQTGVTIVTTNYNYGTIFVTTNVYPSPAPASGVTTRTTNYTTATYPLGQTGVTTNTTFTSSQTAPAGGTYVGNVVTRIVTSGPPAARGTWYDYQVITGYSYPATVYTYAVNTTNYTTTEVKYDYALGTGNYQMTTLNMSGSAKMIVRGDAVLYVLGNLSFTGQSELIIAPGASLKLYVGGPSANFAGNGINNLTADATKFSYYGLPGNTSVSISGNASVTGVIYAPNADLTLSGGGKDSYDLVGATVTKSVKMNGHFKFHYDEFLSTIEGPVRYRAASWNEI